MKRLFQNTFKATLFLSSLALAIACSTQKDTAVNRRLQNLSARYNYIYNSKVLLTDYENKLSANFSNYDHLLPVYVLPGATDSSLNVIIKKAQTIIAEKNVSNYLDEAYILMGQANFYQGNYFTATEYFDYVARTYKKDKPVYLKALSWKARSQFQLKNYTEGKAILDSAQKILPLIKKNKGEAFATFAQYHIYNEDYKAAATNIKAALKQKHTTQEKIRWNYLLAQLYELEKNYQESLDYYNKVAGSNAPFEMYFNANLNRIKLKGLLGGSKLNMQEQILALLKDDKNEGYTDQIYFKAAELFAEKGDLVKAEEYYMLAVAKSTSNQYQKGLAYLRIADLNFGKRGNYLKAKLYYDSAVTTLPKTYPGYDIIYKKGQNLQYLSLRYQIVAFQDSLQAIAKFPEDQRLARINAALGPEVKAAQAQAPAQGGATTFNNVNDPFPNEPAPATTSTFYFSNQGAVSAGFSDFRRKWGNRPLEDNWRQGSRSANQNVTQNQDKLNNNKLDSAGIKVLTSADRQAQVQLYLDNLPLTESLLASSNQKIFDAYSEIAAFYLQELGDKQEAARIYELMLERFPKNNQLDMIFYSLYRAYLGDDAKNAERYKELVLKNYPNSVYAKTIIDPAYSIKQNAAELAVQKDYNQVYANYEQKNYAKVIAQASAAQQTYPDNNFKSQYDYLKAIAIGRTNNVDTLLIAFNSIVAKYPDDKVITPLVKEHIAYINAHMAEFKARKYALPELNSAEPRFIVETVPTTPPAQQQTVQNPTTTPVVTPPVNKPVQQPTTTVPTPIIDPVVKAPATPQGPVIKTDGTFTNAPSQTWYYVVYVNDASLTLSSSRFGIGQFNRSSYPENNLRHQLTELDNDQLIYISTFPNYESVKRYGEIIGAQLKTIMKVPAANYSSFVISKENYDKLDSREKIKQYITFYANSY